MIIDAHTHVWPDKIAQIALSANELPELRPRGDGTVGGLKKDMSSSGVEISCALAIANQARQVDRVNEFVASVRNDSFFSFGTIHVDLSVEENMASLRKHGITAVKVHPLFQGFSLDHPRLWELFEAFGSDVSVIVHVGEGGSAEVNQLATPQMIKDITFNFPELKLIACHFGGYKLFDDAREILDGVNVVLETSWPPSITQLRPERVRDLIRRHGAERIVFGSDWPMTDPKTEIQALDSMGLSDREIKHVLGGTLARILNLDSPWK